MRGSHFYHIKLKTLDGIPAVTRFPFGVQDTAGANQSFMSWTTDGKLDFVYKDGTNQVIAQTANAFTDGELSSSSITLVATADTSLVIYINGVLQELDAIKDGDATGATFANYTNANNLYIGARNTNASAGGFWAGEMGEVMIGNFAPTASEVKDFSGNIPFKWVGASQTPFVDLSFTGSTDGFAGYTDMTVTQVSNQLVGELTATTTGSIRRTVNWLTDHNVLQKKLRLTMDIIQMDGASISVRDAWSSIVGAFTSAGNNQSIEWVCTRPGNDYLYLLMTGISGDTMIVDNLSITQIGAVALYTQDSISETTWHDKANGNDGEVTGAEVLNPPSVTPLLAMHTNFIALQPGATPGTNINCTDTSDASTANAWNFLAITDTTNLAKSGSGGSFALSADGKLITLSLPKEVVGILGYGIRLHDLNSSSTTEMYLPACRMTSGDIGITITLRPWTAVDFTTILDAGDTLELWVSYVTAT